MKYTIIIGILLLIGANAYTFYNQRKFSKIAYVRSGDVLEKYKAVNDAKERYQKKIEKWQSNLDSLELSHKNLITRATSVSANSKEYIQIQNQLIAQERIMESYADDIENKANEENERLMKPILDKVNDYVSRYAKDNNFQIVFGVTVSGNILYGSEAIDITGSVIEGLNSEYLK